MGICKVDGVSNLAVDERFFEFSIIIPFWRSALASDLPFKIIQAIPGFVVGFISGYFRENLRCRIFVLCGD